MVSMLYFFANDTSGLSNFLMFLMNLKDTKKT